jgi:FAD/FMN-containing dehydrogenase
MAQSTILTLDGKRTRIPKGDIEAFAGTLRGELLTPASPGYDEARTVWNAMIDRRPGLIARCAGEADVVQAVNFARTHELLVAVRGGGHNVAGIGLCDGGLVIDLSMMRSVHIDPVTRTAQVEPGCTLGDFDHDAQVFGLATPVGINSTTGIAGLTLGGGFGWLSRKYGMTVDNLVGAEVVTAEGRVVRTSAEAEPDLFWAIRGGGGNFGVVTSFTFRLHPVGPTILSGLLVHPFEDAGKLLRFYRDFTASLPDETAVWVVLRKAPPLPFLPEQWHGKEVVVFAAFHTGDLAEGERILEPLRRFGQPIADVIGPHPYAGWQQAFDPLLTPGARNYWKTHDFRELSDAALDTFVEYAGRLPTPQTEIFIGQMGGRMNQVAPEDTAYPARDIKFIMNVHGRWEQTADDERVIGWARDFYRRTAPFATGEAYVNFLTADESDRIRAAYGPCYDRLVAVKNAYDPNNLFRMNHNIRPAVLA